MVKCKIFAGNALKDISLEDQLNDFLGKSTVKIEDIKIVSSSDTLRTIYAFIFYTENTYLTNMKGDTKNV